MEELSLKAIQKRSFRVFYKWKEWYEKPALFQAHVQRRRLRASFLAWHNDAHHSRWLRDAIILAELHRRHNVMQLAFAGWEDLLLMRKMHDRLDAAASAWRRRKQVEKCFRGWASQNHNRWVLLGQRQIADDFYRFNVLSRCFRILSHTQ